MWLIFKRIKKYESIYLTAIIHFSDVITDYLVLIQYILFGLTERMDNGISYPGVDYVFVAVLSLITIVLNKILSCYYVWLFTENIWDVVLNILDFYIFKEIYASHESGNRTDLMQYLQKIERIFERSVLCFFRTFLDCSFLTFKINQKNKYPCTRQSYKIYNTSPIVRPSMSFNLLYC